MPPSLVGVYYLHPLDAGAIFLNNDLLCNGTCSVTGGLITYWGGHKRKRSVILVPFEILSRYPNIDSSHWPIEEVQWTID